MTTESPVLVERDGSVMVVRLHRPHRHNAWTGRMHAAYLEAMRSAETDPSVRAVIVTGTPPAFSVGGDRDALAGHAERGGYDTGLDAAVTAPVPSAPAGLDADFAWQFAMSVPVIAAVNGACAGIALSLVCACDLRFGAAPAKLTTAAPKLGLPAEYGISWTLPRLVGVTRAADLLLSGRIVTVADTADWGLWNGVAADGEACVDLARRYAHDLVSATGPDAVAVTKRQLYTDLRHDDPSAATRTSTALMHAAMGTAEFREGVAALRERRLPVFPDRHLDPDLPGDLGT